MSIRSEKEKQAIEIIKQEIDRLDIPKDVYITDIKMLLIIIKRQEKEIKGKNAVIDTYKHTERVLTEQIDEQQKEIEEKSTIIMAGAEKVKQLEKEIEERDKYNITTLPFEELKEMIEQNKNISVFGKEYISKNKIRERIKHNENQKNIVESIAKFEINNDGIIAEGLEGLNDLIVYRSYGAVINELNYLLEEN